MEREGGEVCSHFSSQITEDPSHTSKSTKKHERHVGEQFMVKLAGEK